MGNIVSQRMSRGQGNELLNKLEAAGLTGELAQQVIESKDNELATRVASLVRNGGLEPRTSPVYARSILGKNFFGVEEASRYFRIKPTEQQLAYLAEVPFSEVVLRFCKDTHILVAVFPMSILRIRAAVPDNVIWDRPDAYYRMQAFSKEGRKFGWRLIRKLPVSGSLGKSWSEQQMLFWGAEGTPRVQVMVYAITGHFLATGARLFEKTRVRCLDLDSHGQHVSVGDFSIAGLVIGNDWYDDAGKRTGVAAARKR